MGNTITLQEEPEDQAVQGTSYSKISSEPPDNVTNGPVTIQTIQTVSSSANGDAVDARVSVVQDKSVVSSQKTMEISSVSEASGNNLGSEANKAPPAAKSRFVLAFSRPVPGRTEEQATNSSVKLAQVDVSTQTVQANKASSENVNLPAAAAPEEASDKNLSEASLSEIELTAPASTESNDEAPLPKSKELTFFDRLFKLDKGKDKIKTPSQEEIKTENPDAPITVDITAGLQSTPDNVPQGQDVAAPFSQDIVDCNPNTAHQDPAVVVSCLTPEELVQDKPEDIKTAARTDYNNSVMSFLKTLVSPSKGDSKSDTQDKSKKDVQQMANTKGTEQPAATASEKLEANIPPPPEIPAPKQNVKAPPEPPIQQQPIPIPTTVVITNETPKEMTKERSASTPTPLSKLFWKKTPTDDLEVINIEKMEAAPEAPAKEEIKLPEIAETKSKSNEKPAKTNLRRFFKLSVRPDAGAAPTEEVNGQTLEQQTLDFTDRPFTQSDSRESAEEKTSKTSSTEKLSKDTGRKQEPPGQRDSREQAAAETDSLQNGGDSAKEYTPKRTEKKQSFGGFFKGLSPKRMSDAEVQTDPVSIVPAGIPKQ